MADDGGDAVFDVADCVSGENGRVAVIAELADRNESLDGKTREQYDTTGVGQ